MAMEDKVTDYWTEADEEHGGDKIFFSIAENGRSLKVYHDKDIFNLPKFARARELLNQLSYLGEAPYVVADKEADDKPHQKLDSMTALVECVLNSG